MKEHACCFTGHRRLTLWEQIQARGKLKRAVATLAAKGVRQFYAGGALGFDTLAAQAVLQLREQEPGIQLILALPCRDQAARWPERDVRVAQAIADQADEVVCLAERYYNGCMEKRNRYMVDRSGHCVCYLTRQKGGTFQTVQYARQQGSAVYNLADH